MEMGFASLWYFSIFCPCLGMAGEFFERRGRHGCPVDEYTRVTSTFKCTCLDAADLRLRFIGLVMAAIQMCDMNTINRTPSLKNPCACLLFAVPFLCLESRAGSNAL